MNHHQHTQPHSHTALDPHICGHQSAMKHKAGPCTPPNHFWVGKVDEVPANVKKEKKT